MAKVVFEQAGDVGVVRLDDPASLNAVGPDTLSDLFEAVERAAATSRAMLLTASGRAFSAGADLSAVAAAAKEGPIDAGALLETHVNPLMRRLSDLPIPWIAAVRGAAAGVGCSLALSADLIVASESAYFLQAFARVGLVADGGATWLLAQAAGRVRAMEMMLLAERIPAAQAFEWGLVNRVVHDDTLDDTAMALATSLAAGPTRALGMIRRLAWAGATSGWDAALAAEREAQREAGRTKDVMEGVGAFLEKRPAQFRGS